MDAYQQSQGYMRPPPPPPPPLPPPPPQQQPQPMSVQFHHQNTYFHQQQQPPTQQRPPGHQWYPNQFQYQPPPSSPPPPPPQWAPPPAYPYPAHHYPLPPRPHVSPQVSQSYPQPNQDWGNPNWTHHHQAWDYTVPAQNNTQDWAARAKEWANARAAMENQNMQSQYPQSADFHYGDPQQQSIPASSYQQFSVPAAQPHQSTMTYQQENVAISSVPSSYGPDVHIPYSGRDGAPAGAANVGFPHQESSHSSPSVHQQEVPSSYSSVTEVTANQKEHTYRSFPMPNSSAQEGQLFAYGNQAADRPADLSDQPLDFAPRFNHDHNLHMQSSYAAHHESAGTVRSVDPVAAVPSVNSWTPPVAPGVYPPIPHVLPASQQDDPSISMASVPGTAAPQFGRFPGPGFHPAIPSGSAFGIGAGATLHPTTTFPADAYGVSGISERTKKAPVPNWLKEEIIKNKAAITKSSLENPQGEPLSIEDEVVYKSSRKGDQVDSKSVDSSTEEEDDDEDYVEATKSAAINQEIKRILTEILLKVTDELFDEIATKILSEDDLAMEVNDENMTSNYKVSPPPPAIPTPKASAKVLIPVKAKEPETEGASGKTSSNSPGDVLGLANYASDDDDGDDQIQSSSMPDSRNNVWQSSMNKHFEYIHDAAENGLHVKPEKQNKAQTHSGKDLSQTTDVSAINMLSEKRVDTHAYSSNENSVDGSGSNETLEEKAGMKTKNEFTGTNVFVEISTNDNLPSMETRMKSDKNDRHESKSSSGDDKGKDVEIGNGVDDKDDLNRRRQDERHSKKEKIDDRNGSRDKTRDGGAKFEEKAKESKSRKRSTDDVQEDRKDAERNRRGGAKEGTDKKRELSKEEYQTRHKLISDSGRHKKRHSSPISRKGRNSKEDSVSHADDSSDQSSYESKRKRHSRKRHSSPSPLRSSRRQVMRSPHSKHSQRRHSPYSSLETTRGRKSRSRSPVRKQR